MCVARVDKAGRRFCELKVLIAAIILHFWTKNSAKIMNKYLREMVIGLQSEAMKITAEGKAICSLCGRFF